MQRDSEAEVEDVLLQPEPRRGHVVLRQLAHAAPLEVGHGSDGDVRADTDIVPGAEDEPEPGPGQGGVRSIVLSVDGEAGADLREEAGRRRGIHVYGRSQA